MNHVGLGQLIFLLQLFLEKIDLTGLQFHLVLKKLELDFVEAGSHRGLGNYNVETCLAITSREQISYFVVGLSNFR